MALVSNIYANTLASQSEKQLLDDDKLRRIIDSDYDGALKLLSDYGLGDAQTVGKSADEIINAETDKLVAFVREYAHSDSVCDVLLSQFAFNNVKAAYKAMSSGIKVPEGSIYPAFKDYADMVVAKELQVSLGKEVDAGILGIAVARYEDDGVDGKQPHDGEMACHAFFRQHVGQPEDGIRVPLAGVVFRIKGNQHFRLHLRHRPLCFRTGS